MQNDKIIAAIAAYLDAKTEFRVDFVEGKKTEQVFFRNANCSDFLQNTAAEISAAIAPLVEAGEPNWKNAPDWADYWTLDYAKKEAWHEEFPRIEYDKVIRRPRD